MTYTAEKPRLAPSSDELRRTIPGWGVDLDPADRPSVPRERFDPAASGAHWDYPEEQQVGREGRERSIEHGILPPVFGTAQPLHGLSGAVRRLAYARYSEGRLAHWMLLVLGDRIDAGEHHLTSFLTLRPDNPITETGIKAEISGHGWSSRIGRRRTDVKHHWIDPVIVGGPWVVSALLLRRLLRRARP